MTFIIDNEGFLAGAALYGSEAGTWIDFLTLIINKKISGEELRNMIFAFPTQTYMIVSTLIPLLKKEVSLGDGRYKCPCGYIYDPAKGNPKRDIPAGTKFEDLPDTWRCPRCKRKKEKFEAL